MPRQYYPMSLDDEFLFGKYSDKEQDQPLKLWEVLNINPGYVRWCIENIDGFELDNEAYNEYTKSIEILGDNSW